MRVRNTWRVLIGPGASKCARVTPVFWHVACRMSRVYLRPSRRPKEPPSVHGAVGVASPSVDVVPTTYRAVPDSVAGLGCVARQRVQGKFLFVGDEKLYIRGVTYGAFQPDPSGAEYHDLAQVERDFALMARHGINAVRIPHTMPPRALLDIAERYGLWVMVGLSAEQYVGYLIDSKRAPNIAKMIREKVRTVAGHPALLCYGIGNEIPASVARWIGKRRIERYLHRIYRI